MRIWFWQLLSIRLKGVLTVPIFGSAIHKGALSHSAAALLPLKSYISQQNGSWWAELWSLEGNWAYEAPMALSPETPNLGTSAR